MKIAQKYEIFGKVGSQFCQIVNSYSRKGQTIFKIMPKWRNIAISGHTGSHRKWTQAGKRVMRNKKRYRKREESFVEIVTELKGSSGIGRGVRHAISSE